MTFKHGKAAQVIVGASDLSPYLNSADFALDVDAADTTTFGATWKTVIPGTAGSTLAVAGYYDPDEVTLPTLMETNVPGPVTYAPAGAAAVGDLTRLVNATQVAYAESSPVGGVVAVSASFLGDGVTGIGYILHPLGEDTNSTTGSVRDDGAASATGWTAHLHVISVDGGSWVIALGDASAANFSDGADLTGGAFTAATGAASQRLRSAAATTALRRYVLYTATRTGGSAGDGITFALALARNR